MDNHPTIRAADRNPMHPIAISHSRPGCSNPNPASGHPSHAAPSRIIRRSPLRTATPSRARAASVVLRRSDRPGGLAKPRAISVLSERAGATPAASSTGIPPAETSCCVVDHSGNRSPPWPSSLDRRQVPKRCHPNSSSTAARSNETSRHGPHPTIRSHASPRNRQRVTSVVPPNLPSNSHRESAGEPPTDTSSASTRASSPARAAGNPGATPAKVSPSRQANP